MHEQPLSPKFSTGKCVATPGALQALADNGVLPAIVLSCHIRGLPGNLDAGDIEANRLALIDGTRIFSSYELQDTQVVWVITEADRSSTTLLLPSEY